MNIWVKRAAEMGAIFAAGDEVVGLTQHERDVDVWKNDALGAEKLVQRWRGRPRARQAYALLQIAGGLAIAAMLPGDARTTRVSSTKKS